MPRRWLIPVTQIGIASLLVLVYVLFATVGPEWLGVAVTFYITSQILSSLLISPFWTLANDVYDPRQAKRIFGVTQENGKLKAARQIGTLPQGLVSFGTDEAGRIYAVGYEGMIYQLDFSETRFDEIKTE